VGSHLVDHLMMQGHEVTVVDNFFTGRKRNVEHWIGHENFELLHHDIVNPLYIEGLCTCLFDYFFVGNLYLLIISSLGESTDSEAVFVTKTLNLTQNSELSTIYSSNMESSLVRRRQ
jgi:nucleoside-diphosphate-sugar epimerase